LLLKKWLKVTGFIFNRQPIKKRAEGFDISLALAIRGEVQKATPTEPDHPEYTHAILPIHPVVAHQQASA
jgi:hypothetical protein